MLNFSETHAKTRTETWLSESQNIMSLFLVLCCVLGAELSQLHSSVEKSNEEVGRQVTYWSDLLKASLDNANKFDQDYKSVCHSIFLF